MSNEEIQILYEDTEKKMIHSIEALSQDFRSVRTGRASLSLLEPIKVDAYGSLMPINQLATLSIADSRSILIDPWDKSMIQNIERAIQKSNLQLSPSNDGQVIRLNIPLLTEEGRLTWVKHVKVRCESAKVSIRNARREANEELKDLDSLSEDQLKQAQNSIQKLTDRYIDNSTQMAQKKESEIMEI